MLTGLAPSSTGEWHIHEGFGCSAASGPLKAYPGGHFYPGLADDPWDHVTYHADEHGVAVIDLELDGFTVQPGDARTVTQCTLSITWHAGP